MIKNELLHAIETEYGALCNMKKMSGVRADGGCYKIACQNKTIVVKSCQPSINDVMQWVNRSLSQMLAPVIEMAVEVEGDTWIVMKYVPSDLPRERWTADAQMIVALHALHSMDISEFSRAHSQRLGGNGFSSLPQHCWDTNGRLSFPYRLQWNIEGVKRLGKLTTRHRINFPLTMLLSLQGEMEEILSPKCFCHGDPNPTNWRIRNDGSLVLVDWERVCLAHPALDLAITMPWLGSDDGSLESRIAEMYNHLGGNSVVSARQIELAKIWTVIEYLCDQHDWLEEEQIQELLQSLSTKLKGIHE